jgi:phosphatidylserine/phosphatidylglycerophosphate/cardiolipin synthase-like enzyme
MLQGNPVAAPLDAEWDVPVAPFSFVARVRDNPSHTWRSFFEPVGNLEAALSTLEAASYHQKVLMVDDDVAYISGMNVKSTDWDTDQHRVFDHRRMRFNATLAERQAVKDRQALPDQGPRKDYGIRIQGPAARDLDDVLRVRWDHGMATGAMFPEDHTPYTLLDPAPPSGNVTAQVVATMPDPYAEQSILETLNKATRQAKDLIYIEDQYWRAPILHDAIRTAMDANPALHLVVVTKPIALADGGKKYTVLADEELRSLYPDRYLLLQLKTFDREAGQVYFQNMDVHSKIQFIDDVYICVGSANKNNRGLLYEGELNAAVHDPVFVGPARDRVLVNLVGPDRADSIIDRTGAEIFAALKTQALSNASIELELTANPEADVAPAGFVYPLAIEPGWILEVGPDIF